MSPEFDQSAINVFASITFENIFILDFLNLVGSFRNVIYKERSTLVSNNPNFPLDGVGSVKVEM